MSKQNRKNTLRKPADKGEYVDAALQFRVAADGWEELKSAYITEPPLGTRWCVSLTTIVPIDSGTDPINPNAGILKPNSERYAFRLTTIRQKATSLYTKRVPKAKWLWRLCHVFLRNLSLYANRAPTLWLLDVRRVSYSPFWASKLTRQITLSGRDGAPLAVK